MDELLFELIRVSIGKKCSLSRSPNSDEWEWLYEQAERHALLGVCFAGIRQIEQHRQRPPRELYYQWLGQAMQIQLRNERMNKYCVAVSSKFQDAGFKSCVLKGQGVAQLYGEELGLLRQSGDIDLWVDGGMKKALAWARENYGDVSFDYVNAHLPMFQETEVELHWRASMMMNIPKNRRLQRWIEVHKEELQNTTMELADGTRNIHVPSIAFNRWYILLHCYNHIFSEGLGLRQIMDLYFVLDSGVKIKDSGGEDFSQFFLDELGMRRFASAMMWIMSHVFGLERENMLCEPDKKEGLYILNEVMRNGNMGHHDERIKIVSRNERIQSIASTLQHNWHLATHYPSEFFWTPLWIV